jgi:hypothetical protein
MPLRVHPSVVGKVMYVVRCFLFWSVLDRIITSVFYCVVLSSGFYFKGVEEENPGACPGR